MTEAIKWIKKSQKDIKFTNNDDHFIVSYLGIESKISRPTESYQYYLITPTNGTDYIWYDSLNKYFIEKSPTEKDILAKLIRTIDKITESTSGKQSIKSSQSSVSDSVSTSVINTMNVDSNLEYYTLKSKLMQLAGSDKSTLENLASGISVDENVKKLYDDKIVASMLVGEFLDLWKWSKENNSADIKINVEIANDNIYVWNVQLSNFKNENLCKDMKILKQNSGIDFVELELSFHEKFYPNYPPIIKIIKPSLKDTLGHRISNSKMTQLVYWTPTRGVKYIILRTYDILDKFAKIDLDEPTKVIKKINTCVSNMMNHLSKLSSFIDSVKEDDEIDKDTEFIKFNMIVRNTSKTSSSKSSGVVSSHEKKPSFWKAGTGYGHCGNSSWDPEEYVKLQQEKDRNISTIIGKIITDLQLINNTSEDFEEVCKIISNSLLLPYLKQQLKQNTLLDMQNRESTFKLIISLIETLSSEKSIYLFDIKKDGTSLYDVLKDLNLQLQSVIKMYKDNEFIHLIYATFEAIVFPMYDEYKKTQAIQLQQSVNNVLQQPKIILPTDVRILYKEQMTKLRFDYKNILEQGFSSTSIVPNTSFKKEYVDTFKQEMTSADWRKCQKRLSIELASLMPEGQLPIDYEASIFIRVDENNPMIIKALMTGPHDTPYENGCFIFDLYVSPEYPKNFKNCWFMNTGGNRLNPNLYNCGKVCLSILGTWPGGCKSETWNEKTSSLSQVLMSIQSQILIEEPYFNEPGHERFIGSSQGKDANKSYNANIRYYTMCSTIRDLVKNPTLYPHFEDVIRLHFKLKKQRVLDTCKKWVNDAPSNIKDKCKKVFEEINSAIDIL